MKIQIPYFSRRPRRVCKFALGAFLLFNVPFFEQVFGDENALKSGKPGAKREADNNRLESFFRLKTHQRNQMVVMLNGGFEANGDVGFLVINHSKTKDLQWPKCEMITQEGVSYVTRVRMPVDVEDISHSGKWWLLEDDKLVASGIISHSSNEISELCKRMDPAEIVLSLMRLKFVTGDTR
jgi:hypothetical protein